MKRLVGRFLGHKSGAFFKVRVRDWTIRCIGVKYRILMWCFERC